MLSLLFDKDFWLLIICVLLIGVLVWAFIKFKSARVMICTIGIVVLSGFTVYAGFYVNSYYSASGGIFGQVTNLFSSTVDVSGLTFSFDDVQLLQEDNTETYSLTIYTGSEINIDDDLTYYVYVNDRPCTYQYVTSEYCSAEYGYVFYDTNDEEICADTLYLKFYFSKNQSCLYACTKGGSTAATCWKRYFDRNGFVVTLVDVTEDTTFEKTESEITYHTVSYALGDDVISEVLITDGSAVTLQNYFGVVDWQFEDGTSVSSDYVPTEDVTLYASMYSIFSDLSGTVLGTDYFVINLDNGWILGHASGVSFELATDSRIFSLMGTGLIFVDSETHDISFLTTEGYGWNSSGSIVDGYIVIRSIYSTVDEVIVNTTNMTTVATLGAIDFDNDSYVAVELAVESYIVFSSSSNGGVYVYSLSTGKTTRILSSGTWTSFSTLFNEQTGEYSTVKIKSIAVDYYYRYDVVTGALVKVDGTELTT